MDELSSRARALLAEAQDGHDPPADVSQRVWQSVSADIAGVANIEAARALAHKGALVGKSSIFASKMFWVMAVIAGAGVGGIALRAPQLHDVRGAPIPSPSQSAETRNAADAPEITVPVPEKNAANEVASATPPDTATAREPAEQASAHNDTRRPGKREAAREDALLLEVSALRQASDMLADDRPGDALALLHAQEKRFANGTLRDERQALTLLARCTLNASATVRAARAFIARTPNAVLRARVEKACKLTGEGP
jgi:hypothetical protein